MAAIIIGIGRTGRAGKTGRAFTLATPGEKRALDAVETLIGRGIEKIEIEGLESPGDTCGFNDLTDQVNISAEDLNLGPLADNGGPTETHALVEGSVAIDVIPAEDCVDADDQPLTTDQRGYPRPVGDGCDVGAFERQP